MEKNKESIRKQNSVKSFSANSRTSQNSNYDHLKKCDDNLQSVLMEIPQFESKRLLIPYYTKIENEQQKRKQVEFWKQPIEIVLEKHIKSSVFTLQEIKSVFTLDKFIPLGLETVMAELYQQKLRKQNQTTILKLGKANDDNLILIQLGLLKNGKDQNQSKKINQTSFLQKFNIFRYIFGSNQQEEVKNKGDKLQQQLEGVFVWIPLMEQRFKIYREKVEFLFQNKWEFVIGEREFSQYIKTEFPYHENELIIFLDMLIKGGIVQKRGVEAEQNDSSEVLQKLISQKNKENYMLIFIQQIAIQVQISEHLIEENHQVNEEDINELIQKWKSKTVIKNCKEVNSYIEEKSKQEEKFIEEQENIIKKLIQEGKKDKAKRELASKLLHEKRLTDLYNKKQSIDKVIFQIEDALVNAKAVDIFKISNTILKENSINFDVIQDIQQDMQQIQQDQNAMDEQWKLLAGNDENNQENELLYQKISEEMDPQANINKQVQQTNNNYLQQQNIQNNNNNQQDQNTKNNENKKDKDFEVLLA